MRFWELNSIEVCEMKPREAGPLNTSKKLETSSLTLLTVDHLVPSSAAH